MFLRVAVCLDKLIGWCTDFFVNEGIKTKLDISMHSYCVHCHVINDGCLHEVRWAQHSVLFFVSFCHIGDKKRKWLLLEPGWDHIGLRLHNSCSGSYIMNASSHRKKIKESVKEYTRARRIKWWLLGPWRHHPMSRLCTWRHEAVRAAAGWGGLVGDQSLVAEQDTGRFLETLMSDSTFLHPYFLNFFSPVRFSSRILPVL